MNQPIHNAYWLSRFESILNSALAQHRAVSLIRVVRLTSDINDVPTSVCVQPLCVISGVGSLARKKAGNIIT